MSRPHVDNEALAGTVCNALKRISHFGMMSPSDERRPHFFYEGEKLVLCCPDGLKFSQFVQLSKKPLLLS
jgi:hypothetical protein